MKTTQKKTNKLCLLLSVLAFSIVLLAKPMTAQAADVPSNIRQTDATTTQITLAWDAVPNANDYDVQYSADNGKTWTNTNVETSNKNTATISYLTKATTYQVRVAAKDSTGAAGDPSKAVEMNTSPEVTQAFAAKITNATKQGYTITWPKVEGATGYKIEYTTGTGTGTSTNPYGQGYTEDTSITMNLEENDKTYFVFITPYRTSANASFKAEAHCTGSMGVVLLHTLPSALKTKDLYIGIVADKGKTLYFDITPPPSSTARGYQLEIYSYKNKKLMTLNAKGTRPGFTVENSKFANTPIKFRARAYVTYDGGINKYYGDWSEYSYYTPSAVVTNKILGTNSNATTVKLKWKKVKGAKSYTIYHSSSINGAKGTWKVVKKNVKGTSINVKIHKGNFVNSYYVQANSVSFKGKKGKVSSPNPNKSKDYGMHYSYMK